jgi:hypothetical protein
MHLNVPPLTAGCPWSTWPRPNVKWCENNLCAFITTPANTWSNFMYCFFAYKMWKESKNRPSIQIFALSSLLVGVTSFAYHASYTKFFQFFDFVGMFCFCMTSVTLNARRLEQCSRQKQMLFYSVGVGICTMSFLLVPMLGLPVQILVVILILTTLGQEWWLQTVTYKLHPHMQPNMTPFYSAFLLLFIAFGCSIADLTRVWCNPDNHLVNGHSMWHILTSIVLYLLFKYHSQFAYEEISIDSTSTLLPIKLQTV